MTLQEFMYLLKLFGKDQFLNQSCNSILLFCLYPKLFSSPWGCISPHEFESVIDQWHAHDCVWGSGWESISLSLLIQDFPILFPPSYNHTRLRAPSFISLLCILLHPHFFSIIKLQIEAIAMRELFQGKVFCQVFSSWPSFL